MPEFAARWLATAVLALLFASLVIFAVSSVPDGDPALRLLGQSRWAADVRSMSRDLDPRLPFFVRYVIWLSRVQRYLRAMAQASPALPPPAVRPPV